jgi:RND family efflux transporter MFP subunit
MRLALGLCLVATMMACGGGLDGEAPERPALSTTLSGTTTELFAEYPAFVRGEPSRFAAHVTRLADWRPLASGRVTVVLTPPDGQPLRVEADAPDPPGIFRPVVTPDTAGPHRLEIVVDGKEVSDRFDLGTATVHASEADAIAAEDEEEGPAGVTFLLEQQWRTDFAVGTAERRPLRDAVRAYGSLEARLDGDAHVVAPVTGRVVTRSDQLPVLGTRVARDQVMALVAPRLSSEADPTSLVQAVERARRDLELARSERARLDALLRRDAVPERRVIEARHHEHDAQSDLAAAEHELAQFRLVQGGDRSNAVRALEVRTPIAGTVVAAGVSPGAFVEEGHELYRVVDIDRLRLEVRIPEADIGRIAATDGAWFEVEGVDRPFEVTPGPEGIVIGGALDDRSRTVPLALDVPNPDGLLRVGMSARARVFTGRRTDGVAVPVDAVVDDAGQPVVYVQLDGEHFERRPVSLGVRDGTRVEIREGLDAGARLVVRGAYLVHLAGSSGAVPAHGHAH